MLSFLEVSPEGSVNVSKLAARPHVTSGVGGFIDITAHTKRLIFSGYFTTIGQSIAIEDGKVAIKSEGRTHKFVLEPEQITLNGKVAQERGQSLTYVTERGVFRMLGGRMTLVEVAPGVDVRAGILDQCDFPLEVSRDLQTDGRAAVPSGAGGDGVRALRARRGPLAAPSRRWQTVAIFDATSYIVARHPHHEKRPERSLP